MAPTMLKELSNRIQQHCCAVRFGGHGINVLGVVRWLKSLTLTLRNNVQHDLQTNTTCNIQQCCVRLQGA